jgi:uncharacterized protein YcfL
MKQIFIFMITALLLSGCETTTTKPIPASKKVFQDRLKDGSLGPKMVRISFADFVSGWFFFNG